MKDEANKEEGCKEITRKLLNVIVLLLLNIVTLFILLFAGFPDAPKSPRDTAVVSIQTIPGSMASRKAPDMSAVFSETQHKDGPFEPIVAASKK